MISTSQSDSGSDNRIKVRVLCPDEWHCLKAIRLRALEDSPESFASHLPTEQALTEDDWREQLKKENWIIAHDVETNQDIGMMAIKAPDSSMAWLVRDADCWIHSCWIAPDYRGGGGEKGSTNGGGDGADDDNNRYTIIKKKVKALPAIMKFVDTFCEQQNWHRQGLGVFTENIHAIKAYERFGFDVIGDPMPSRKIPGRMFVAMFKSC